jgi:hypothetical protein
MRSSAKWIPRPLSLRRFAAELSRRRHAVVKRYRIEVEAIRPGERAKFDEDAGEEFRVLQRPYHFAVARRGRGKIVHAAEPSEKPTRNV